jgi:hypothetical protein
MVLVMLRASGLRSSNICLLRLINTQKVPPTSQSLYNCLKLRLIAYVQKIREKPQFEEKSANQERSDCQKKSPYGFSYFNYSK